jgi:PIN domain.
MTVIFDAEPLLAFAFGEQGAGTVEHWLNRVYDGDTDGYMTTINLTEFRYVAARKASLAAADTHIDDLRQMGLTEYHIDELWDVASELKTKYSPALGDAYALAAAKQLDSDTDQTVTPLVGADDNYDVFEHREGFQHLIERFRSESV